MVLKSGRSSLPLSHSKIRLGNFIGSFIKRERISYFWRRNEKRSSWCRLWRIGCDLLWDESVGSPPFVCRGAFARFRTFLPFCFCRFVCAAGVGRYAKIFALSAGKYLAGSILGIFVCGILFFTVFFFFVYGCRDRFDAFVCISDSGRDFDALFLSGKIDGKNRICYYAFLCRSRLLDARRRRFFKCKGNSSGSFVVDFLCRVDYRCRPDAQADRCFETEFVCAFLLRRIHLSFFDAFAGKFLAAASRWNGRFLGGGFGIRADFPVPGFDGEVA